MLIYHNRYDTSGDWHDMSNNQPLTFGNISIAMNGVLSMKPKNEYEKEFNVNCITENDTEVFVRKMLNNEDILDFLKNTEECTFASVILKNNKVYALRNNKRPLHWFKYNGAVYVVSTADIVKRVLKGADIYDIPKFEWFDLHEKLQN